MFRHMTRNCSRPGRLLQDTTSWSSMAKAPAEEPQDFLLRPDVITPEEERALLDRLENLRWDPIVIRGQSARRTARHFGLTYDYESRAQPRRSDPGVARPGGPRRRRARGRGPRGPRRDFAPALPSRVPDRMAPRRPGIRSRRRRLAAGRRTTSLSAGPPRSAADMGGPVIATVGIPARGRGSTVMGALDPANQRAALLDHIAHAPSSRRAERQPARSRTV